MHDISMCMKDIYIKGTTGYKGDDKINDDERGGVKFGIGRNGNKKKKKKRMRDNEITR